MCGRLFVTGFAAIIMAGVGYSQTDQGPDFLIGYVANLDLGDSFINFTNFGATTGTQPAPNGNICVNVYAFSPDEQLVSCCSCPITPNGLKSLSVRNDILSNTITPKTPTSLAIKTVTTYPTAVGTCASPAELAAINCDLSHGAVPVEKCPVHLIDTGAWYTVLHPVAGVVYATQNAAPRATLSNSEYSHDVALCAFIQANGSGYGICSSCRTGADMPPPESGRLAINLDGGKAK